MIDKQLESRLAEAAQSLTTDLPFERIAQAIPAAVVQSVSRTRRRRPYLLAVAACVAVALAVGGLWHHFASPDSAVSADPPAANPPVVAAGTVIDIDVNPSVEITVDTADCISAVTAVNTDAALLLSDLDLTQQPLEDGVKTLFGALVAHGYVDNGSNQVLVTVQSGDATEADRLHAIVNSGVDDAMAQHSLTASVVNQTVTAFDEVTEFAQKHGISNGKAAFVLNLVEQQPTLKAEELVHYAFSVLAAIAQHHDIPLSELVNYDAEGSLWQSILEAHLLEMTDEDAMRWGGILSVSEIKELALKAMPSDYIAENALLIHVDMVIGDDQLLYRVELVSLGYLYEYVIDADDGTFQNPGGTTSSTTPTDSGTIRSTLQGGGTRVPVELPDEKDPKTTTALSATPTTTTATTTRPTVSDGPLTEERAKEIVFFRIGISEAEAHNVSVGHHPTQKEMSVSLVYENTVHCFYLDSTTGTVTKIVHLPLDVAVNHYRIDEWEALQIALNYSDMTEEACGEIIILYSMQDGTPYIDVVWTITDGYVHHRIHGESGEVLEGTVGPLVGTDGPPTTIIP